MAYSCSEAFVFAKIMVLPYFLKELPNFIGNLFSEKEKEKLGRFISVTDSHVEKLVEGEENTNKKKSTI